jgi:hypothetical protein
MHTFKYGLSNLALVFAILITGTISTRAMAASSLTLTLDADSDNDCGHTAYSLDFIATLTDVVGQTNDVGGTDHYLVAVYDRAGNLVAAAHESIAVGTTMSVKYDWPDNDPDYPIRPPVTRFVRAVLFDPPFFGPTDVAQYLDDTPLLISSWFDMGSISPACAALPAFPPQVVEGVTMPPDDRINWQFGDSNVGILYPGRDGAVDLYIYATQAYIFDFVTPDDLKAYEDNPPSTNTLLKQVENISVYILTTGQIQFNFGPDAEGKVWVLVLNDLSDTDTSNSYYIDPNE